MVKPSNENGAFVLYDVTVWFSMPLFVHGHEPNGTATMKRLHARISYRYEDVDAGGRVRVTTTDPKALSAVHDFMKFQIKEHRTGDRGEVEMDR